MMTGGGVCGQTLCRVVEINGKGGDGGKRGRRMESVPRTPRWSDDGRCIERKKEHALHGLREHETEAATRNANVCVWFHNVD